MKSRNFDAAVTKRIIIGPAFRFGGKAGSVPCKSYEIKYLLADRKQRQFFKGHMAKVRNLGNYGMF